MTITIPNALANSIVVALGRTIAMTKVEKNRNAIKCDAAEFIRLLPANYQESCDWLLNETVKIWSEPK